MPRKSMTVLELMNALAQFGPEDEVWIAVPSGDHWGNILAERVRANEIDYALIQWSDYHESMKVSGDDPDDDARTVLMIGNSERDR